MNIYTPLEECKLRGTKVSFSAGHNCILLTSRSYRSTNSEISQSDGMGGGTLVRQCKETGWGDPDIDGRIILRRIFRK